MSDAVVEVQVIVEPLEGAWGRYAHPARLRIDVGTETVTAHYHPQTGDLETGLPVDLLEIARWWARSRTARFAVNYFPPMPYAMSGEFWLYDPFRDAHSVERACARFEQLRDWLEKGSGSDHVDGDFDSALHRWVRHRVLCFADPRLTLPPVAFCALGGEAFVEWVSVLEEQASPFVCDGGRWRVDGAQVDAEFEREVLPALDASRDIPEHTRVGDFLPRDLEALVASFGVVGEALFKATAPYLPASDLQVAAAAYAPEFRARSATANLTRIQDALAGVSGSGWRKGREVARRLLQRRNQARIADPDDLARELGIPVIRVELGARDVQGWCVRSAGGNPTIFVNTRSSFVAQEASRLTVVGHELYHALVDLRGASASEGIVSAAWESRTEREQAANRFAAELVAPKEVLEAHFNNLRGPLASHIESVAKDLGIGKTVVLLNAAHFGLAPIGLLRAAAVALGVDQLAKVLIREED